MVRAKMMECELELLGLGGVGGIGPNELLEVSPEGIPPPFLLFGIHESIPFS